MNQLEIFVDFDGTVTRDDVVDMILSRFADPSWLDVEKEWHEGRIGSRECLRKQFDLVKTDPAAFEALLAEVRVDPGFVQFLKTAKKFSVPVAIVSDGFDLVIQHVLQRELAKEPQLLEGLEIFCNKLYWQEGKLKTLFPQNPPCKHGCATCKEYVILDRSNPHGYIVFVGDGLSDRYAAKISSLTFAKNKLLALCKKENYNFKPYASFHDIEEWIRERETVHA